MSARPPIPDAPFEGGCLCGAVRFRVNTRPLAVNACHCVDCRRATGAGAAVFLHLRRSELMCLSGDLQRYRKTADSGRFVDIVRCADCGVRLWHEPVSAPELLFLAAGTLDDPSWAIATSHIWAAHPAPDAVIAPDALVIAGPPADRQALWDHFSALYPD